jgi:N-acyl-D-aspartate/D-glutamate deacylase
MDGNIQIPETVSEYLARIGKKGGSKSRRGLSAETARNMVRMREARRAFRKFHAQCFWHMKDDMDITSEDIPEIVRGLRQNGGREGFLLAAKLCP